MAETIRVKLQVASDVYELAKARHRKLGYASPEEYLGAILAVAMDEQADIEASGDVLEDSKYGRGVLFPDESEPPDADELDEVVREQESQHEKDDDLPF